MGKLLIVDDELDVREFAANFFRKRKINVLTAASGQEALEKIEQELPQLGAFLMRRLRRPVPLCSGQFRKYRPGRSFPKEALPRI